MKRLYILGTLFVMLLLSGCDLVTEESYTVFFETDGGTEIASLETTTGSTILEPTAPVKEGHEFSGWFSDSTFNFPYNFANPVTGDLRLYAKWEPMEFTIQYVYTTDSELNMILDEEIVLFNAEIPDEAPAAFVGHTFAGWFLDEALTIPLQTGDIATSDMTLYARFELASYHLTIYGEENEVIYEMDFNTNDDLVALYTLDIDDNDQTIEYLYMNNTYATMFHHESVGLEDTSLYVRFETKQYEVLILDPNLTVIYETELEYGMDLSMLYTLDFDNDNTTTELLYLDPEFETLFDGTTMEQSSLTLYTPYIRQYTNVDTEVVGEINLMTWSGSGTYYEDLGHLNLDQNDLIAQKDAMYYAIAKAFNDIYPNVIINLLSLTGGPTDGGRLWDQELYNFEQEHGSFPSIWTTDDLVRDVQHGLVADLSRYQDDPLYQQLNPTVMNLMNYNGFQAGLPEYIIPWGIYVNRELADLYNLDVPDYDWDIDEYTDFIANSEDNVYYGSMDAPIHLIETGVTTIYQQLFNGDGQVDLNSSEVRSLLPYLQEWREHSVWGNDPDMEFMDSSWWWSYKFFLDNKLLTLEGDPWMMGDCATPIEDPNNPWWATCTSNDWDIYPRPATDYVDNNVGIVLDPMAIYNYCLEDGDLACTDEEEAKIQLAYTFAMFSIADTRAWDAVADQTFRDIGNGVTGTAMNDRLPVTTGDLFNEQMEVWYRVDRHERFADEALMPGFQEVLRLFEDGQFWDISDKAFPFYYSFEGSRREILFEWKQFWNPDVNGGVSFDDPNFIDTILGNLPSWNEEANNRFEEALNDLEQAMQTYYNHESTNTGTTLELHINGLMDHEIVQDDVFNVLEGVFVADQDNIVYPDVLLVSSPTCDYDDEGQLDTSFAQTCVLEYQAVVQGVLVSQAITITIVPRTAYPNDVIQVSYDFEDPSDLEDWSIFQAGSGSVVMSIEDGAMKLVTTSGVNRYETRIDCRGVTTEDPYTYLISFRIKSDIDGKLVHVNYGELLPSSPWFIPLKPENIDVISLTTEWQEVQIFFTATSVNENGGILFEMGNMEGSENLNATIWIDDIVVMGGPVTE